MNMSYFGNSSDDETYGGDDYYDSGSETSSVSGSETSSSASDSETSSISGSDTSSIIRNPMSGGGGEGEEQSYVGLEIYILSSLLTINKKEKISIEQIFLPTEDYIENIKSQVTNEYKKNEGNNFIGEDRAKAVEIENILKNLTLDDKQHYRSQALKIMYYLTHYTKDKEQIARANSKGSISTPGSISSSSVNIEDNLNLFNKCNFIKFLMKNYDYYSKPENYDADSIHAYYESIVKTPITGGTYLIGPASKMFRSYFGSNQSNENKQQTLEEQQQTPAAPSGPQTPVAATAASEPQTPAAPSGPQEAATEPQTSVTPSGPQEAKAEPQTSVTHQDHKKQKQNHKHQ